MNFSYMDLIVAAIVGLFAVFGYKRGFVRSVVGMLSLAASVLLAWLLYPVVSDLLGTLGVRGAVYEKVQETMATYMGGSGNMTFLPQFLREAAESGRQEIISTAATAATDIVLNIIAFIVVLIASRLIILIAQKLLIVISHMPIIGLLNRIAGMLFGAAQGVLVVLIVFTVIYATMPIKENSSISNAIENSAIAKKIYNQNPVVNIFISDNITENQNGE